MKIYIVWIYVCLCQVCNPGVGDSIHKYGAKTINGTQYIPFSHYAGKHVLIVNVATYWGLTFQYVGKLFLLFFMQIILLNTNISRLYTNIIYLSLCAHIYLTHLMTGKLEEQILNLLLITVSFMLSELNALHEEFRDVGFTILGFPCNQFGKQEPGDNNEILPALKWVHCKKVESLYFKVKS